MVTKKIKISNQSKIVTLHKIKASTMKIKVLTSCVSQGIPYLTCIKIT